MRLLITGVCGFVGSTLARALVEQVDGIEISGIDNFIRPGSETNREVLKQIGVRIIHGDIRLASDLEAVAGVDWVIDAAANPSVLAGVDGRSSSRQVVEHNLFGTVNLLEFCRSRGAGIILLSTSRVYSIKPLAALPVKVVDSGYAPDTTSQLPPGLTAAGVSEGFATSAPVSLYGATKLASEQLAVEYAETFGFPVWINRCGVLAGAGQFGRADQGIFAYWIHSWAHKSPLKYIGFDGAGHQVRDCLHPRDLVPLLQRQMAASNGPRIANVSGGTLNSMSLRQLSDWCTGRFGPRAVASVSETRQFDIPWMVLDSSFAGENWGWAPSTPLSGVLEEIALHAESNPGWLQISAPL